MSVACPQYGSTVVLQFIADIKVTALFYRNSFINVIFWSILKFQWAHVAGCKDGNADSWIDRIVDVKRVKECIMCLKVLIGDKLVNCIYAYAPQTGKSVDEKDCFWDQMNSVTGSIPASELIVVGGDLNGHVGTNVDGYDGVDGGYGFGERNADGEWILEFCDAVELIVTNTCFKRQKNKIGHLCIW